MSDLHHRLTRLTTLVENAMSLLDEVSAAVTALSAAIDAEKTADAAKITALEAQVAAAGNDPALQTILDQLKALSAKGAPVAL